MRWDIYNTREWWLAVALNCTTRDRWWWWWYADVEGSQVPHTATAKSHSGIQINRMKKKKNKNHTQKILQNINNFYTSFSRRRSLSISPHLLYYLFDTNIYAIRRWARAVCIFFLSSSSFFCVSRPFFYFVGVLAHTIRACWWPRALRSPGSETAAATLAHCRLVR